MPITRLEEVTEGRLCWPDNKPRVSQRRRAEFKTGLDRALQEIEREMTRWPRIVEFIVSRNKLRIYAGDPGVALWWLQKPPAIGPVAPGPELRVLACDKWDNMGHNAWAIYLTLDAMRSLERWGAYTAEQAAQGARLALPPPVGMEAVDWKTVLGYVSILPNDKQLVLVEDTYRRLSKAAFAKGDEAEQTRLNLAIEAARAELKT